MTYTKHFVPLIAFLILVCSCGSGQNNMALSATDFAAKMKALPSATILDVRSPDEYEKGHIAAAKNINWNGDDFDKETALLDKSKPILVYCLSGGRSSAAASKLRSEGFKEVYEMEGGLMKWRAKNLPESSDGKGNTNEGMTEEQYNALLNSDKMLLIDFYAEWCEPCKKIKPFLDEIAAARKNDLDVIRINVDENPALAKALKIESIPLLKLYKNKALAWQHLGLLNKDDLEKQLK